jgi:hypothetical protein
VGWGGKSGRGWLTGWLAGWLAGRLAGWLLAHLLAMCGGNAVACRLDTTANAAAAAVLSGMQDISAVEDARQACQQQGPGHEIPDGFVKIVQMRPARANASHA